MEAEQKKLGLNIRALYEILFGTKTQKQNEEDINEELERIYAEERKSGATKRIQELGKSLTEIEPIKEKTKIQKVKTKAKTSIETQHHDNEQINEKGRELGE